MPPAKAGRGKRCARIRHAQFLVDFLQRGRLVGAIGQQAEALDLQRAQRLLQALLEGTPDGIASPTLFICVVSVGSAFGTSRR